MAHDGAQAEQGSAAAGGNAVSPINCCQVVHRLLAVAARLDLRAPGRWTEMTVSTESLFATILNVTGHDLRAFKEAHVDTPGHYVFHVGGGELANDDYCRSATRSTASATRSTSR